ncbi:rho GTPase-activating protein 10-like isoform X2 [Dysidea avara]|uniref:rho GTPase-activating protein 10-like isoform X2 n=1 Tax=Dysidea avara TaxID=196820 RepID=UPI0033273975
MGLTPLEYLDCFLDSPAFRENLQTYEKELDTNSAQVKNLTKECRRLIQATEEFSKVQESFAHTMKSFKFEIIGETQTQDEIMITESLKLFADVLLNIEEQRRIMLSTISARMLDTLEKFRKEHMQVAKDEKKRFERISEKYYNSLEKYLGTSAKKKDVQAMHEFDSALFKDQAAFQQTSFTYACQLQDVHAAKQYELVEPILGYMGDVTTFLHQAYDTALSTRHQLEKAQHRIQLLRDTHIEEQQKAYELKAKIIEEGKQGLLHHPQYIKQGFLMVQERRIGGLTHSWIRYFCQFSKSDDVQFLRLIPIGQYNKPEFYQVKQCVRCKTDEVDRRFCIEVEIYMNRNENVTKKYFMQAMSQGDMKEWLEVMEGREPMYATMPAPKVSAVKMLSEVGYKFVCKCVWALEKRGLTEEGIYRKPGILSKATKLMKECVERGKLEKISLEDECEYDNKTVASAIKFYFSKQITDPLMTHTLYDSLIGAAKVTDYDDRVTAITNLVKKLPQINHTVLCFFINHLSNVALHSNYNLMQASNLGVVFGPTLLRPEVETVASIKDIKYQNIIVEIMIDEKDRIFRESPPVERRPPPQQPVVQDNSSYDSLEPATTATSSTTTATIIATSSELTQSTSADNIPNLEVSSKPVPPHSPGSLHKRRDTSATPQSDDVGGRQPYAIPPRRIAPRPPPHTKKPFLKSSTTDSLPNNKNAASPTTEKYPPVFRRSPPPTPTTENSKTLPNSQPDEKKQFDNKEEKKEVPDNRTVGHMRPRAVTAAVTKKPFINPNSPRLSDKKRNLSDNTMSKSEEHLDKNDNRFANQAEGDAPPIPWRTGRRARTLYDCDSDDPNELSFKKGQILMEVTPSDEPGWLKATLDNHTGLVPENYVELLS